MSLQSNDLRNLVATTIHIDEYQSKMGDNDEVVTMSFKVKYRDPAIELTNFIEKGYVWVLDADVSSGEMEDGSYLVFVEMQRRPTVPEHIVKILEDLRNVTGNNVLDYKFAYFKDKDYTPVTVDNLKAGIPLSAADYRKLSGETDPVEKEEPAQPEHNQDEQPEEMPVESIANNKTDEDLALESMQMAAGLAPRYTPTTDPELRAFVNLSRR